MTPSPARTRRLLHQPAIGRIDPERERRRAVGHQVDPQDLRREQRQHERLPLGPQADRPASSTPKNIVMTSPMFDESR